MLVGNFFLEVNTDIRGRSFLKSQGASGRRAVILVPERCHRRPDQNPAHIAFNKKTKSLLLTNYASLAGLPDPSFLFAILDVYVNDKAGRLFEDDDD